MHRWRGEFLNFALPLNFQSFFILSLVAIKSIAIGKIKVKKNHNALDWFLYEARYAAQTARNKKMNTIIPNKGNDPTKSCDHMLGCVTAA